MRKHSERPSPREDARLPVQALRYALAAFGGFAADYGALLALKELAGLHYLIAVPLAFLVGLAVNYLIGVWFVFRRGAMPLKKELALFLIISLLALAVTEGSMYLFTDLLRVDYRISRVFSGVLTYLFNFFSRRMVLYREKREIGEVSAKRG
jgi:putative flippase GtrA